MINDIELFNNEKKSDQFSWTEEFYSIPQIYTIKDLSDWANLNKIPLLYEEYEENLEVFLTCFNRDKNHIEYIINNYFPLQLLVHIECVPDQISYNQKALIEYKEKLI